jgi:hypothetical protein
MPIRWVKRIPEGLLILLALPVYQLWYIAKYARCDKSVPLTLKENYEPLFRFSEFSAQWIWPPLVWLRSSLQATLARSIRAGLVVQIERGRG